MKTILILTALICSTSLPAISAEQQPEDKNPRVSISSTEMVPGVTYTYIRNENTQHITVCSSTQLPGLTTSYCR